jgi:uncharacterized protein YlxW (UPF0749 family)
MKMKIGRTLAITLICLILGVMVAWQYKSINFNQQQALSQNKRADELKDDLIVLQKQNNDMRNRLDELINLNEELQDSRVGSDEAANSLKKSLEQAKVFAGLTEVKGKGVIVTLDNNDLIYVLEEDILDIINEMRAAGAQAISVNDERVVATTEIREAGNFIMINGVKMQAPFSIKAISDPNDLDRALRIPNGVIENLVETLTLKVNVIKSENIVIPKVREEVLKTNMLTPVQE